MSGHKNSKKIMIKWTEIKNSWWQSKSEFIIKFFFQNSFSTIKTHSYEIQYFLNLLLNGNLLSTDLFWKKSLILKQVHFHKKKLIQEIRIHLLISNLSIYFRFSLEFSTFSFRYSEIKGLILNIIWLFIIFKLKFKSFPLSSTTNYSNIFFWWSSLFKAEFFSLFSSESELTKRSKEQKNDKQVNLCLSTQKLRLFITISINSNNHQEID
jgi:hypothetical protein